MDLTMLVLSAICVAETDGQPITAGEIAFLLEIPREAIDASLHELIADGSIRLDGDLCHMSRSLTAPQLGRMEDLSKRIQELWPQVDDIPVRLDS